VLFRSELTASIELSNGITDGFNIDCAGSKTGSIHVTPVNAVISASYIWSDGSTSQNRSGLGAGDYTLIMTDANFCYTQRTITLAEPDSLKLSISVSEPWCPAKPDGALSAVVSGGVIGTGYSYKWSDNSTGSSITGILPGDYSIAVTDRNNCIISKSIELKPQNETCLVIPNAISPNGDLINDLWNIGEIDLYPNVVITIFNRWGESLWRSDRGYHNPWDGTSNGNPLPIDSYHYIIDLHNGERPIIGTVTIVR
jgi:gliding motility-associated-like protein